MLSFMSAFVPTFDGTSTKGMNIAGAAQSRSTSAGSSVAPSSVEDSVLVTGASLPMRGVVAKEEIPEYDYPAPFIVKNTFIDTVSWRPSSLDGFFQERQIQSCVSRIDTPPFSEPDTLEAAAAEESMKVTDASCLFASNSDRCNADIVDCPEFFDPLDSLLIAEPLVWQQPSQVDNRFGTEQFMLRQPLQPWSRFSLEQEMWQQRQWLQDPQLLAHPPLPPPPAQAPVFRYDFQAPATPPPPQAPALQLSEAIPELELGSAELPTKGSAGHHTRNCKPCAFFHTKGCAAGSVCEFCHLCDAGERKLRRKEKLAFIRESREKMESHGSTAV